MIWYSRYVVSAVGGGMRVPRQLFGPGGWEAHASNSPVVFESIGTYMDIEFYIIGTISR